MAGKKIAAFCAYVSDNKYAVYVLVMLMLTYLINQVNTFCLIATNHSMAKEMEYGDRKCSPINDTAVEGYLTQVVNRNHTAEEYCEQRHSSCEILVDGTNSTLCYWRYSGLGLEYQLLAGPLYIVLFSISGIPMGLISELNNINRKLCLVVCAILWSVMTIVGGLATQYWHLAATRIIVGIFSAGCAPFSASLISDYFEQETRGAALGFYNWGIFVGYSVTHLLLVAEEYLGWRTVYFISGVPGVVLAILTLITVKEPEKGATEARAKKALSQLADTWSKLKAAANCFVDPALLLLCLGGAIRNGAGIAWTYNTVPFFNEYHPGNQIENWMTWIPLVFGSIAAFSGGLISDKLAATRGTVGRLIVLVVCTLAAMPFQVGTLYLPTETGAFLCHIPGVLIGEMWIGVCIAVVIDLVPADLRTSAVAVYFFIIMIIGGNTNLLIPLLNQFMELREALLVIFPGFYVIGAILFVCCLLVILKRQKAATRYTLAAVTATDDVGDNTTANEARQIEKCQPI